MMLSDRDIRKRLEQGNLEIQQMENPDEQIQPCSVDCTLDDEIVHVKSEKMCPIDVKRDNEIIKRQDISDKLGYPLSAGEFVLATTRERFNIPDDLVGHMEGRSSMGRLGVMVHVTAGLCDPGFEGQITLELKNVSDETVVLYPGMRISQMTFTQLTSPAEEPYGEERGSKYQSQEGPTASRISDDFE